MPRQQRGVKGTFNFAVRDFFLLVSLIVTGGNLAQCWKHSNEIDELKKLFKPETKKEIVKDDKKSFAFDTFFQHNH